MDFRKYSDWFLAVAGIIVSYCFCIIPLTNDARIYLGVEHIAANYYPFPQGIDLAWEIKPIFNRVINFVLYKIATLFVPFEDHFLFLLFMMDIFSYMNSAVNIISDIHKYDRSVIMFIFCSPMCRHQA